MDRGVRDSGCVILGDGVAFSREPWSNVSAQGIEPLIGINLYDGKYSENDILRLYPEEDARIVVGIRPRSCGSIRDCLQYRGL